MIKKVFTLLVVTMTLMTMTVFAAEDKSNSEDSNKDSSSFTYTSLEYNYSIVCPKRPNIVTAAVYFDDDKYKGEVLIFDNDGYNVKRAWVILFDAFNTNAVPNFNVEKKEIIEQYLIALQKQGYIGTALIDINKDNKGVLAITAKEIDVDEDGDGQPDATLVTDHQEAITFFRMPDGRCVSLRLVGTDDLSEPAMNNFRKALTTFGDAASANQNSDKDKKKTKKDKKDKKDKKK